MRSENWRKVWEKTPWPRSFLTTAGSKRATPSPFSIAGCDMPAAAASRRPPRASRRSRLPCGSSRRPPARPAASRPRGPQRSKARLPIVMIDCSPFVGHPAMAATIWAPPAMGKPAGFDGTPADRLWHDPAELTRCAPPLLNPLFRPVTSLSRHRREARPGAAPSSRQRRCRRLPRVVDLLFHLPVAIIDRSRQPGIALVAGRRHRHAEGPRRPPPEAAARQPPHPLQGLRP